MLWERRRGFGVLLAMSIALVGRPAPVLGLHFDKGDYVTAMKRCLPAAANTATAEGIPACSPPVPLSDCAVNPAGSILFAAGGRGDYVVRPTGRILTQTHGFVLDIDATFRFSGLETCDGGAPPGKLFTAMVLRMTLQDPACQGGRCTLPDLRIDHPTFCAGRSCRERLKSSTVLDGTALPKHIPWRFPWTAQMLSLSLVDKTGNPVTSQGLRLGRGGRRRGFPASAGAWEARMVRAYGACDPASTDTFTGDGLAACSNPRPLSDCEADTLHAIAVDPLGKGKVAVRAKKKGGSGLRGRIKGLLSCNGADYTGVVKVAVIVRVTLEDAACEGGFCTTVDTPIEVPVYVRGGSATLRGIRLRGIPRGDGTLVNAEIVRTEVRDQVGRAVLAGHGLFVRCDPRDGGAELFCYGN